MAFTVTPTSGAAPYILSADIINTGNIDGVNYVAAVFSSQSIGSCPSVGETTPLATSRLNTLLSVGSVDANVITVPAGSCRTFTLSITRLSDNVVVDSSSVSVDNL